MIDANDGLQKKQSLLPTFLHNTNLIPLIINTEMYPPTYVRGSHCIDFIFGSPHLAQHVESSGMTSFFDQPWPNSDHRGLFVDINTVALFGASLHTIPPTLPSKITSKCKKICNKLLQHIIESQQIPSILKRITDLSTVDKRTSHQHQEANKLDELFTKILLQPKQAVAGPVTNHSNDVLHNAYVVYTYWATIIKGLKNNRDVSKQLQAIIEKNNDLNFMQDTPTRSPKNSYNMLEKP
jgi:hypothetical protein